MAYIDLLTVNRKTVMNVSFGLLSRILILGCFALSACAQPTEAPENTKPALSNAQATSLPPLEPVELLRKMHVYHQKELLPIKNFSYAKDEDLSIYVRKEKQGADSVLNALTTNRVTPGRQRFTWRGNQFEIWNRGGFANLKKPEKIAGVFTAQGTGFVDGVLCYKLSVDRKQLFTTEEGRSLFYDTQTTGNGPLIMFVDPNNWLIRRFEGQSEAKGKPITVMVTWKDPIRFGGLYFWQRRETVITGEGVLLSTEDRKQVEQMLAEMRQQLRQVESGEIQLSEQDKTQAIEALQTDILRTEDQLRALQQGKMTEQVYLRNIQVNKGIPEALFNPNAPVPPPKPPNMQGLSN